jgi:hypothetical protein
MEGTAQRAMQAVIETSLSLSLSLYDYIYMVIYFLDLGRFFNFLLLYSASRTPWTGDHHFERPLPTHRTTETENKCTQTFMLQLGYEPKIQVFERAKTVHAFDRAATVICLKTCTIGIYGGDCTDSNAGSY